MKILVYRLTFLGGKRGRLLRLELSDVQVDSLLPEGQSQSGVLGMVAEWLLNFHGPTNSFEWAYNDI